MKMKNKTIRILLCIAVVMMIMMSFSMTAFAAGDVAGAIEQTWNTAKTQVQSSAYEAPAGVGSTLNFTLCEAQYFTAASLRLHLAKPNFTKSCRLLSCMIEC